MKGQAYINGKDIWETWRATLLKGAYEALLKPASMKSYISNSSRMEHGVRYVTDSNLAKTDERSLSIPLLIEGSTVDNYISNLESFMAEMEKGSLTLNIPALKREYKLVYTDCSSYGDFGEKVGKFTLKLIEPNTKDRNIFL